MAAEIRRKLPLVRQIRLPTVAAEHPAAIVSALAEHLTEFGK
jgi:hypothetical protein